MGCRIKPVRFTRQKGKTEENHTRVIIIGAGLLKMLHFSKRHRETIIQLPHIQQKKGGKGKH